ncbi:MAG: hypothetical protein L6Q76_23025 [Polyangiaceae bacterium]|nr:hypothetical protein [Polyangiaceae bacterium]
MSHPSYCRFALSSFGICAVLLLGCGGNDPGGEEELVELGTIEAQLSTVPQGVQCIRITSQGARTVRRVFSVTPGAPAVILSTRLPIGPQSIVGEAFDIPCPASGTNLPEEPTWLSDPVFVTLAAKPPLTVKLVLRPNTNVIFDIDFEDQGSARAIASGGEHACALLNDDSAWCWGSNGVGQVGDGTGVYQPAPVAVAGLGAVREIAAGYYHTCAVMMDGTARCWGNNMWGQLGDGTTTNRLTPVPVAGISGVRSIGVGDNHTCVVLDDETVRCWGFNPQGQLGAITPPPEPGYPPFSTTPIQPDVTGVKAVVAGVVHTCALLADATVTCWGHLTFTGLSNITQITAGSLHSCGLSGDGSVLCWGHNVAGQLGDGTTTDRLNEPAPVVGLVNAAFIEGGGQHTCAVLDNDTVTCWGSNIHGQLGDGSFVDRFLPGPVVNLPPAQVVAPGTGAYTCALTFGGAVGCWGAAAQLGTGSTVDSPVPVVVSF